MKYDLTITMYAYRVQEFCKRRGLYTMGSNQKFEELLQSIRMQAVRTPDQIVAICANIVQFSDPDCEWIAQATERGLDDTDIAKAMAGFLIHDACDVRVEEVH